MKPNQKITKIVKEINSFEMQERAIVMQRKTLGDELLRVCKKRVDKEQELSKLVGREGMVEFKSEWSNDAVC